jgi:hypothetical protein
MSLKSPEPLTSRHLMVLDAALRVIRAADTTIGIRGIIVHAISAEAKDFYVALGFDISPLEPMTLMITLNDLRACQVEDI